MKKIIFALSTSLTILTTFTVPTFADEIVLESTAEESEFFEESTNYTPDGSRSNPYRLGDTISFKSYGYDGNSAEYSILFTEYLDCDTMDKEYPRYILENKIVGIKGSMSVTSASTDDSISLAPAGYVISEDMNETNCSFNMYVEGDLSSPLYNVYSGGKYDFLMVSNDLAGSKNISYIKLQYMTDTNYTYKTIWISINDTAPATEQQSELDQLKEQVSLLEAEIERLKGLLNAAGINYEITNNTDETVESISSNDDGYTVITLGEQISLDFVEFTIDGWAQGEELIPENPTSYYRYFADTEGQSYFYVWGTLKNTSGNSYEFADSPLCNITFNNKYNYTATISADEGGTFSYIYAYLDPLVSEKFYISVSIPDELATTFTTAEVKLSFMDNFEYNHSSIDSDYTNHYKIIVTKE